jgi:hypothetical protein
MFIWIELTGGGRSAVNPLHIVSVRDGMLGSAIATEVHTVDGRMLLTATSAADIWREARRENILCDIAQAIRDLQEGK